MIIREHSLYKRMMISGCVWSGSKTLVLYTAISMTDWKPDQQIWTSNQFSMSAKQQHTCTHTFYQMVTSFHELCGKLLSRLLRTICIIMRQWKQSHKLIQVNVNALFTRQFITTSVPQPQYISNINVSEERTQCLLSEKKLNELPDGS